MPPTYTGYALCRKYLFRYDPEQAHDWVKRQLRRLFFVAPIRGLFRLLFGYRRPQLAQERHGIKFPVPVGLAAGFDKDGDLIHGIHSLGFGFAEVGTVTLKPQAGNPKPRLKRLPEQGALVNSLGFNNAGLEALIARLSKLRRHKIPIGVNIGKNRDTPLLDAQAEYLELMGRLYPYADFIVVNVSSPNTPGLRELQKPEYLEPLLRALSEQGSRLAVLHGLSQRPIFVKLAPELSDDELGQVLQIVKAIPLQGVVAVNTLKTDEGGLSGAPLYSHALKMIQSIRKRLGKDFTIIGVGGIASPKEAEAMLKAGANLLELYTGYVYHGPCLIPRIHKHLARTCQISA